MNKNFETNLQDNEEQIKIHEDETKSELESNQDLSEDNSIYMEQASIHQDTLSQESNYTFDQLHKVIDHEISNVNFIGTLDRILQGMHERYISTSDSIFNPNYQAEIEVFITELKKAENIDQATETISRLNNVFKEMVNKVEYGAFSDMSNRDKERSELTWLAEDFNLLKTKISNDLQYALYEVVGKDDKNLEFVRANQEIKDLDNTIVKLIDILYVKAENLK